jgi:glycosyltransferase involved in cell wall biosynthesis
MNPLASVIVPVYNGARFLRAALDSVLAQTYRPVEIVVVDDGSTDVSPGVIASYGDRVRSLRQANSGVAAARNAGIRAASGELIALLDQDDWWLPGKMAAQVERFAADPGLGLVHTGIVQYSEDTGTFVDVYDTSLSAALQGHCHARLMMGNGIFNSSVMLRKSAALEAGLLDPSIPGNTVQDYDLWLRVARRRRLGFVPDQLTVLRLHEGQGTWDRRAMLADELRLLERHVGRGGLGRGTAMRGRVARLLDELGRAHLEAGDAPAARSCFARALGMRCSWRAASLYAVSFLPRPAGDWVRRQRQRWRHAVAGRAPRERQVS